MFRQNWQGSNNIPPQGQSSPQGWVTISDPNEGAFIVQMPANWQNQAYLVRPYGQVRSVVNARSPDGRTLLFTGDPNLPTFTEPSSMYGGIAMMNNNPLQQVHPVVPAEPFFTNYVQRTYGQHLGFRITNVGPSPRTEQEGYASAQKYGMNAWINAVCISFTFQDNSTPVHGRIHGSVLATNGIWVPSVSGYLTTDDPAPLDEMLHHMASSYQTNPQWRQMQDNNHQQAMNQINTNHQNWMNTMQAGHQSRMDAIQHAGQVNTQIHNDRMAQSDINHQNFMNTLNQPNNFGYQGSTGTSDDSHERFLNYIKDENTVTDQSGQNYQVETGHDRYYVNKRDNSYIGTDSTVSREDLRSKWGLNPDDYEEVKIKR